MDILQLVMQLQEKQAQFDALEKERLAFVAEWVSRGKQAQALLDSRPPLITLANERAAQESDVQVEINNIKEQIRRLMFTSPVFMS